MALRYKIFYLYIYIYMCVCVCVCGNIQSYIRIRSQFDFGSAEGRVERDDESLKHLKKNDSD